MLCSFNIKIPGCSVVIKLLFASYNLISLTKRCGLPQQGYKLSNEGIGWQGIVAKEVKMQVVQSDVTATAKFYTYSYTEFFATPLRALNMLCVKLLYMYHRNMCMVFVHIWDSIIYSEQAMGWLYTEFNCCYD